MPPHPPLSRILIRILGRYFRIINTLFLLLLSPSGFGISWVFFEEGRWSDLIVILMAAMWWFSSFYTYQLTFYCKKELSFIAIYLFIYLNQRGYMCCYFIGKFGHCLLLLILMPRLSWIWPVGILSSCFLCSFGLSLLSVITSLLSDKWGIPGSSFTFLESASSASF